MLDLLERETGGEWRVTLDGNENFHDFAGLPRVLGAGARGARAAAVCGGTWLVVEQPVHRDQRADADAGRGCGEWTGSAAASSSTSRTGRSAMCRPRSRLGYVGRQPQELQGHRERPRERGGAGPTGAGEGGPAVLTGEDLCILGPVALLQDLAMMALLGIGHVERNGHHYYRGLSLLPASWQDADAGGARRHLPRHADGFACLDIVEGRSGWLGESGAVRGSPELDPSVFTRLESRQLPNSRTSLLPQAESSNHGVEVTLKPAACRVPSTLAAARAHLVFLGSCELESGVRNAYRRCASHRLFPWPQLRHAEADHRGRRLWPRRCDAQRPRDGGGGYLTDHVAPLLVGRDARRIEDTWQYLYKGAYWRRGPVTMAAIAAVDTALWDIRAKSLGVPVYQLLGGASRERGHGLRARQRQDARRDGRGGGAPPEARLQGDPRAVRNSRDGPRLRHRQRDRAVRAGGARPAAGDGVEHRARISTSCPSVFDRLRREFGYELHLLHDVHHRLTPIEAGALGKSLEPYRLFWMEDPVPAELQDAYRLIRQHTTTPIAVGEVFNTIFDCHQLIAEHLIDYIRTTVTHAGGISHLRKIAALAELHHVRTGCHGATDLSPVAMAAALHFGLSVHNFGIQEHMPHNAETRIACSRTRTRTTQATCTPAIGPGSAWTSTRRWLAVSLRTRLPAGQPQNGWDAPFVVRASPGRRAYNPASSAGRTRPRRREVPS